MSESYESFTPQTDEAAMTFDPGRQIIEDSYTIAQETAAVELNTITANGSEVADSSRLKWVKRGLAAATIVGAGVSLGFEQSPANEAIRINIGTKILEMTQDAPPADGIEEQEDSNWLVTVYEDLEPELAVAGGVAGATLVIEGVPAGLIALGLHEEHGPVRALARRRLKKRGEDLAEDEGDVGEVGAPAEAEASASVMDKVADAGIALGIGSGLVVAKRHIQAQNPTLKEDLKNGAKATALVSAVSGGIGFLLAGGIQHADKVGMEKPAEYFIDYATDWKFWTGVVAGGYALAYAKKGAFLLKDKIMDRFSRSPKHMEQIQEATLESVNE